ncbi:MAG: O-methyltransferase [Methylocystis sp.]
MSGASLPYHLRPHKAVDRRLFIDLLSRCERWKPLSNYVYLSMGAYALEDHKLVHRLIGITQLIAFDCNDDVVARQRFNKPVDSCHCIKKKSGDIIANLELVLSDAGFGCADGVVVWLDYTDPSKLGEQIREFEALLDRLRAGDIVRVTVNAHPQTLGAATNEIGKPIPSPELRAKRFQKLRDRINDYLPSWASEEHVTETDHPRILAGSFAAAALKALPVNSENVFLPLSIVRYADGQQMLSITGAVVKRDTEAEVLKRLDIETWPFASIGWATVHQLVVPDLTVRERLFLERGVISKTPDQLIEELGFKAASEIKIGDFLENFKNYYRFYPTLLSAEL